MPPGRTDPPTPKGPANPPCPAPPAPATRLKRVARGHQLRPVVGTRPRTGASPGSGTRGARDALGTDGPGGPAASHAGGVAVLAEPPLGAIRTDRAPTPYRTHPPTASNQSTRNPGLGPGGGRAAGPVAGPGPLGPTDTTPRLPWTRARFGRPPTPRWPSERGA